MAVIEYQELADEQPISFQPLHPSFGKAEFSFCLAFKRGKIIEVRIERAQQNEKGKYLLKHHGASEFIIGSFLHGRDARVWRTGFCKDHKGQWLDVYVPDDSTSLTLSKYSEKISADFR